MIRPKDKDLPTSLTISAFLHERRNSFLSCFDSHIRGNWLSITSSSSYSSPSKAGKFDPSKLCSSTSEPGFPLLPITVSRKLGLAWCSCWTGSPLPTRSESGIQVRLLLEYSLSRACLKLLLLSSHTLQQQKKDLSTTFGSI